MSSTEEITYDIYKASFSYKKIRTNWVNCILMCLNCNHSHSLALRGNYY